MMQPDDPGIYSPEADDASDNNSLYGCIAAILVIVFIAGVIVGSVVL